MKCALLLLALCAAAAGEIVLFRGGRGNTRLRTLTYKSCLPDDYITIQCTFRKWPGRVVFRVNGKYVRTETKPPYTIAGDVNGYKYAWKPPRTRRTHIACIPQYGRPQRVSVRSQCPAKIPVWRPKPRKPKFTRERWNPKPYKKRAHKPKPRRKPAYKPRPVFGIQKKFCVVVPWWKYTGKLAKGWVRDGAKGAVGYKPHDNYGGVFPGTTAVLRYRFKVPRVGRYGVTLDMSTSHYTEHNDCWLKLEGGFRLTRYNKMKLAYGFTKAYHNSYKGKWKGGRSIEAYSVDHNRHSFSTAKVLYPWRTYTILLGARSTKMWVHRIILFPCNGRNCGFDTPHWKKYVNTCASVWPSK